MHKDAVVVLSAGLEDRMLWSEHFWASRDALGATPLKLHSAAITSHAIVTRDKRAVSATSPGETKDAASIQLALFVPLRAHN